MSRRWLSLALLLLSACYRNNPSNCISSPGICSSAEVCDPTVERCVNPNAMRCDSGQCPGGFSCNQQTLRCDPNSTGLSISSIDKTFIKSDGGDVVVITGTGFQPGMQVLFNNDATNTAEILSPTQLRVTTPFRAKGTNRCGKLPLTVIAPDQTRQTAPGLFAYYFDATSLVPHPALSIVTSSDITNLQMADLDRDGVDELTVGRLNLPPLLFASSAGQPAPPGVAPSARPGSWVTTDLEANFGNLLVADSATGASHVYRFPKGTGALTPGAVSPFLAGAMLVSVAAVDLDGDGFRDVIGLQTNGQLVGSTRSPDWMVASEIQIPSLGIIATSFVADRYFADTVRVAAVSTNDSKLVLLVYDNTARKMRIESILMLPDKTAQILDGDVDGDGAKDLVVLMQAGAVKVFLNKGSFSDVNTLDFTFATTLSAGVVGDLNCDGAADVVGLAAPSSLQIFSIRTGVMPKVAFTNIGKPGGTIADFDGDAVGDLILFSTANQPLLRYGTVKQ